MQLTVAGADQPCRAPETKVCHFHRLVFHNYFYYHNFSFDLKFFFVFFRKLKITVVELTDDLFSLSVDRNQDPTRAIPCQEKCLNYTHPLIYTDPILMSINLNNLACIYMYHKQYAEAFHVASEGLGPLDEYMKKLRKQRGSSQKRREESVVLVNTYLVLKNSVERYLKNSYNLDQRTEEKYRKLMKKFANRGYRLSVKYLGEESKFTKLFRRRKEDEEEQDYSSIPVVVPETPLVVQNPNMDDIMRLKQTIEDKMEKQLRDVEELIFTKMQAPAPPPPSKPKKQQQFYSSPRQLARQQSVSPALPIVQKSPEKVQVQKVPEPKHKIKEDPPPQQYSSKKLLILQPPASPLPKSQTKPEITIQKKQSKKEQSVFVKEFSVLSKQQTTTTLKKEQKQLFSKKEQPQQQQQPPKKKEQLLPPPPPPPPPPQPQPQPQPSSQPQLPPQPQPQTQPQPKKQQPPLLIDKESLNKQQQQQLTIKPPPPSAIVPSIIKTSKIEPVKEEESQKEQDSKLEVKLNQEMKKDYGEYRVDCRSYSTTQQLHNRVEIDCFRIKDSALLDTIELRKNDIRNFVEKVKSFSTVCHYLPLETCKAGQMLEKMVFPFISVNGGKLELAPKMMPLLKGSTDVEFQQTLCSYEVVYIGANNFKLTLENKSGLMFLTVIEVKMAYMHKYLSNFDKIYKPEQEVMYLVACLKESLLKELPKDAVIIECPVLANFQEFDKLVRTIVKRIDGFLNERFSKRFAKKEHMYDKLKAFVKYKIEYSNGNGLMIGVDRTEEGINVLVDSTSVAKGKRNPRVVPRGQAFCSNLEIEEIFGVDPTLLIKHHEIYEIFHMISKRFYLKAVDHLPPEDIDEISNVIQPVLFYQHLIRKNYWEQDNYLAPFTCSLLSVAGEEPLGFKFKAYNPTTMKSQGCFLTIAREVWTKPLSLPPPDEKDLQRTLILARLAKQKFMDKFPCLQDYFLIDVISLGGHELLMRSVQRSPDRKRLQIRQKEERCVWGRAQNFLTIEKFKEYLRSLS